jgi:hypothetical protein
MVNGLFLILKWLKFRGIYRILTGIIYWRLVKHQKILRSPLKSKKVCIKVKIQNDITVYKITCKPMKIHEIKQNTLEAQKLSKSSICIAHKI